MTRMNTRHTHAKIQQQTICDTNNMKSDWVGGTSYCTWIVDCFKKMNINIISSLCFHNFRESTQDENKRIDCYPERLGNVDIVTKEKCESRHCVYDVITSLSPDCYFSSSNGYKMIGYDDTELGIDYNLTWKGTSPFGNVIKNAIFRVEMREDYILRFKV